MITTKTGLIIAIAVGGPTLALVVGIWLTRVTLRARHRRSLAEMATLGDGRSSRLGRSPSSIMHITDQDVARMPGTNNTHRLIQQDGFRCSPYTPMSSRGSTDSRPVMKTLERVKRNDVVSPSTKPAERQRPLPRRLTRSDGTPLVQIPKSSSAPMTEVKKRHTNLQTNAGSVRGSGDSAPTDNQQRAIRLESSQSKDINSTSIGAELVPAPLFHDKPRKLSYESIFRPIDSSRKSVIFESQRTPPTSRNHHRKSTSICSQASQAPSEPPVHMLPRLSFEPTKHSVHRVRSMTDVSGCGSILSDNTSILDYDECRTLSRRGTDFTSLSVITPVLTSPVAESTPKGLRPLWATNEPSRDATQANSPKSTQSQVKSQKPFRASVQETIPDSASSGLSMSLLNHGSNNGSTTDLASGPSPCKSRSKAKAALLKNSTRRPFKRNTSPSSPLRNDTGFTIYEDTKVKVSSMPVLGDISGNRASNSAPHTKPKRPSSIAFVEPKERSRVTASTSMNRSFPSRFIEGLSPPEIRRFDGCHHETSQESLLSHTTVIHRADDHRDSTVQLSAFPAYQMQQSVAGKDHDGAKGSHLSPTMSMFPFYNSDRPDSSSGDSAMSTPTRKPKRRSRSPDADIFRKKPFFNQNTLSWEIPPKHNNQSSSAQPAQINHAFAAHAKLNPHEDLLATASNSEYSDSRPGSHLYNFPDPPSQRLSQGNRISWRSPKTPIRGPRAPPERLSFNFDFGFAVCPPTFTSPSKFNTRPAISPFRKSASVQRRRQSRTPSPSKRISKTYGTNGSVSNSPGSALRKSIMVLRRQNSEISVHVSRGSKEHRRYVSIGEMYDNNGKADLEANHEKENDQRRESIEESRTLYETEGDRTPRR